MRVWGPRRRSPRRTGPGSGGSHGLAFATEPADLLGRARDRSGDRLGRFLPRSVRPTRRRHEPPIRCGSRRRHVSSIADRRRRRPLPRRCPPRRVGARGAGAGKSSAPPASGPFAADAGPDPLSGFDQRATGRVRSPQAMSADRAPGALDHLRRDSHRAARGSGRARCPEERGRRREGLPTWAGHPAGSGAPLSVGRPRALKDPRAGRAARASRAREPARPRAGRDRPRRSPAECGPWPRPAPDPEDHPGSGASLRRG